MLYRWRPKHGGVERHEPILPLAWAIGAVQILLFVALMLMGSRRREGVPKGLILPFALGSLAYVGVFTAVVWSYRSFARDPAPELWLALPLPTALMLYLLWPLPIFFAAYYVFGFRRFVLTEEDQATFQEMVLRRRAAEAATAADSDAGAEGGR